MSAIAIRAALETQLAAMTPALLTAWENDDFTPPASSVAYQTVHLLFAEPDNSETGSLCIQAGFMQVTLRYPLGGGSADITTRAEQIKSTFHRGASFSSGGITVTIHKTPQFIPASRNGDRFDLPVRVPFRAQVSA